MDLGMTRSEIQQAIDSGAPFTIYMADGREYQVPHQDYIALPPHVAHVYVFDDEGRYTVLPLLTMTGIRGKQTAP
jgi:cupin superfamily acireductone dioxygenase involved in methionine salvage